jgi:hypothetical protein
MSDWRERLTQQLEPALRLPDPRTQISAYHDMPYAIFRYPPEDEFAVRQRPPCCAPAWSRSASA